jgi:acetoin utilization deacetylase AcuC-like enzyme
MNPGHPECPQRLHAIGEALHVQGLHDFLQHHEAPAATHAEIARVHGAGLIEEIHALAPDEGLVMLDPDTLMNPATLTAALHAAGALVRATDLVMNGRARNAFCAVRPPGHHAERDTAMGFCFFNNVAVGAAHALAAGLARVAILDFDVHHGNGTEDIFADEPRVLFCSSYEHPQYPYKALPSRPGRRVNTPLATGSGSAEFRAAVTHQWLPEIERFRPELIFVSAGFDAHRADPLGGLRLEDADYAWITGEITALAARHCEGRIVSTLEGGYDLAALARCAALHVRGLLGA